MPGQLLDCATHDGAIVFTVRVQPRAAKDEIAGILDGALKVRLRAPAVEDRANLSLCEFLAQLLKTPKSAVRIRSGQHSRIKCVEIFGVSQEQIFGLLQQDV